MPKDVIQQNLLHSSKLSWIGCEALFCFARKCLTFFCKGSLHYSATISWFVTINSSAQAANEFFMSTVRISQNKNGNNLWSPRTQRWSWILLSLQLWSGRFLGITGWHPSVCKSNRFASLRCGDVNPKSIVKEDTQHQFNARESA